MTAPRPEGLSPYDDFLWTVKERIRARGGTPGDFRAFIAHLQERPGAMAVIANPKSKEQLAADDSRVRGQNGPLGLLAG